MPEMSAGVRLAMVLSIAVMIGVIVVYHVVLNRQERKNGSRREPERPRRAA